MNRREFLALGACAAAAGCVSARPDALGASDDEVAAFWRAVDFLKATKVTDYDRRQEALAVAQKMIYAMCPADERHDQPDNPYNRLVEAGLDIASDELADLHARFPALDWYDSAFDRVLAEVQATTVAPGAVPAVWYVYNMGVIVKTSRTTFSIDLCHRQAVRAVPVLDFALISHNHEDHYTTAFLKAMRRAKKPVITNFCLYWDWYCRDYEKTFTIGDVTVRCTATDHNPHLPKAVNCHEVSVDRGAGVDPFVIFHSGDCSRVDQIKCSVPHADLFIGHCAIGFSFPDAYRYTMKAKRMVIAHHQELGHLWSRWRCVGFHEEPARIMKELRALGAHPVMPVWGDRLA